MKKFSFKLCALLLGSSIGLATLGNAKDIQNGSGYVFAGAELGLGNAYWAMTYNPGAGFHVPFGVSLGALGGYHYYFPTSWQFSDFRHGIRGYGALDYGYYEASFMFIRAGVDWTIDFTPKGRYVWGAFGGFSVGGIIGRNGFFGYGFNFGGSLEMLKQHRFEVSLGYGFQILNLRYIYKF